MNAYKPRLLDALIARKLQAAGAVVLRGPRAVGKTTTALHHAGSSVRLDQRREWIRAAELAPGTLLAGPLPRLIDEWQLAPSIWNSTGLEIDAIVERRDGEWIGIEIKLGGERAIEEAVMNFGKLHARLTDQKLGHLAALCVVTGGQTSYTRPDGIHVVSVGHLRA